MTGYYVSPTGNDTNPGTILLPFKTVQKAASVAVAGDVVQIRAGVYRETVIPTNSGTQAQPIVYRAFKRERVVISGAEAIASSWTQHSPNILKTQVPANWVLGGNKDRLYLGEKALRMAMWPKPPVGKAFEEMTWFDYARSTAGSFANTPDQNGDVLGSYSAPGIVGNWTGGNITFIPGCGWGGQTGRIVSSGIGNVSFRYRRQPFQDAYDPVEGNAFFLWGKLEALTQAGEYFIDAATNTVYLWLPKGNPAVLLPRVEIKVRQVGLQLGGRQYIKVEGINFFSCRIEGNNASNIELKRLKLNYPWHDFVLLEHGIWLKGDNNKLIDSDVSNCSGPGVLLNGNNCEIVNNVISNFGYLPLGGEAIETAAGTTNLKIERNTIFNGCAHGIVLRAKASQCRYNRIFRVGLRTIDIRGIEGNQAGDVQGTEISYNMVHDLPTVYDAPRKYWGASGIGLDAGHPADGVTNYRIHRNIVFRTSSYSISVWPVGPAQLNYGNSKNEIVNNTCDAGIYAVRRTDWKPDGTKFLNNICTKFEYGGDAVVPPGAQVGNNLFRTVAIAGNLQADPGFVSPLNYNFLLAVGSPAIAGNMGAMAYGVQPFVTGASIFPEDIRKLQLKIDPSNPSRLLISGLPVGRNLPAGFALSIQGEVVSESFYNAVDCDRGTTVGVVKLKPGVTGFQRAWISLDGEDFFITSKMTNFTGFLPTSARKKPRSSRAIVQGMNFYSYPESRVPVKLSSLPASGLVDPILIKLDTQSLVASGLISSDCSNLGFFALNGAAIQHWLEDRPNHPETLIWLKFPSDMQVKVQTYEDEPTFFVGCGRVFSPVSASTIFPPLAQAAQWLKVHKLSGADLPVASWPADIGSAAVQATSGKQAVLRANVANGLPALEFDGVDDFYFIGGNFTTSDRGSFFVVYRNPVPGSITHQRLLSASSSGTLDWQVGLQLLPELEASGVPKAFSSPQVAYQTLSSPRDLTNLHLAVRHNATWGGNIFKGQVFEVLCVKEALSAQDEMDVREKYLKPKYGIKALPVATVLYEQVRSPVKVMVNNQPCPIHWVAAGLIEVVLPALAPGRYPMVVTSPDGTSFSVTGGVVV